MKILVAGVGGVGGFFGGMLLKAGLEVDFLARGAQLEALKSKGLNIESVLGDVKLKRLNAFDRCSGQRKYDLVLVCVKTHQTKDVVNGFQNAVHGSSAILSLQNGVQNHQFLSKIFGHARVLGGLCQVGAYLTRPACVQHVASGKIQIGVLNKDQDEMLDLVFKVLDPADFVVEKVKDIQKELWRKWLWNIGFNGPTAILDVSVAKLLKSLEQRQLVKRLIEEGMLVAQMHGYVFSEDLPEKMINYSMKDLGKVMTSMLIDRRNQKPLELAIFYSFLKTQANRHGLKTPVNDLVLTLLSCFSMSSVENLNGKK